MAESGKPPARTLADDMRDYEQGKRGIPTGSVAGQIGYRDHLSAARPVHVPRIPRATGDDRAIWLVLFVIMVVGLAGLAIHDGIKDAVTTHNMRSSVLMRETVVPMGWAYHQSFTVPEQRRAAFDTAFQDVLTSQPKIIECFYSEKAKGPGAPGTQFQFWLGSVPEGADRLYRLAGRGHVIRSYLGVGAVTKCPKMQGEAWDTFRTFQARLPAGN